MSKRAKTWLIVLLFVASVFGFFVLFVFLNIWYSNIPEETIIAMNLFRTPGGTIAFYAGLAFIPLVLIAATGLLIAKKINWPPFLILLIGSPASGYLISKLAWPFIFWSIHGPRIH